MRLPKEPEKQVSINILPMIDVLFAILTFFIISTLDLIRSDAILVDLPQAQIAASKMQAQKIVTISKNGMIAIDGEPVELEKLETTLQTLIKPNSEVLVFVYADKNVRHGHVVAVMTHLQKIKGVRLAIGIQGSSN